MQNSLIFRLAKNGPEGDESNVSTRAMGTFGYTAPEYITTGIKLFKNGCILSEKSLHKHFKEKMILYIIITRKFSNCVYCEGQLRISNDIYSFEILLSFGEEEPSIAAT